MENKNNNTPSSRPEESGGLNLPQFNSQRRRPQVNPPSPPPPPPTSTTKQSPEEPTTPPAKKSSGESVAKRKKKTHSKSKPKRKPDHSREDTLRKREEARAKAAAAREARDAERRQRRAERGERVNDFFASHKSILRNSLGYFALFLCVLVIICTLTATVFLLSLLTRGDKAETPKTITLETGDSKSKYSYEDIVINGVYYVDMSALAEFSQLTVSGDSSNLVFTNVHGERLSFDIPSRYASVNGISVMLEGEVLRRNGRLWIPYSFAEHYLLGLTLKLVEYTDDGGKTQIKITASRIENASGDGFLTVSYLLKPNDTLGGISDSSLPEQPITLPDGVPEYEFVNDLSSYYQYMSPSDPDKYLLLANPSNVLDAEYVPEDMIPVLNIPQGYTEILLSRNAEKSLEALFTELYSAGYMNVTVMTAYRSYETQKFQFDNFLFTERYYYTYNYETTGKWFSDTAYSVLGADYIQNVYIAQNKKTLSYADAERVARSYSALPGTSDHQTGLGCNLYIPGFTGTEFADTEAYAWLCDNAHKFGFIFRYPDGKETVTGYPFEPGHLRFVGQYHALRIHSSGLTLEEYVAKYIKE